MLTFEKSEQPLLIAGPCSAETREQVLQIADDLSSLPINIFRAGIWKPRTKPGNFEGCGSIGLQWLQEVKQTYRTPVATEVAQPQHIEQALKHGIDVLHIYKNHLESFQSARTAPVEEHDKRFIADIFL